MLSSNYCPQLTSGIFLSPAFGFSNYGGAATPTSSPALPVEPTEVAPVKQQGPGSSWAEMLAAVDTQGGSSIVFPLPTLVRY